MILEPMEETGKGLGLSSKTETLDGEAGVPQKESCIDEADTVVVSDSGVFDVSESDENEKQARVDVGSVTKDSVEKTVSSDDVEKTDAVTEPETDGNQMECEGDAGAVEVKPVNGESHESAGKEETVISGGNEVTDEKGNCEVEEANEENGEMLSAAEDEADQEEETRRESEEDEKEMDVDSKHANEENDSDVAKEMEVDERNKNADLATDLTGAVEPADSENRNSPSEDAATGEVEPVDHHALFDPSSDITNFIDFSGVSSWSGNIQDLKTETANVSLKEDKKATECPTEASDAVMESDENQEEKGHECLDEKAVDQQDTLSKEDDTVHEAPSIDPNHKEDTEMEENPNNFEFADDGTDSDMKSNGVKRKADALSEDSPGEGRKTVSFAKVSFAQRPSFKIGACIARAASQMAGSPSVLKGSNFGDETLSVESFVSQLHCVATDPVKENVVSEIAAGFFLDFRNSLASQQATPEKVSNKRGRPSNSSAGGTEAFEFEEMGDTYWTDRVIHNGGEEQTPTTDKENYQVVPVELKPAQIKRTRRPYRRRQSLISTPPPSATDKPANFDENAPAELIMNFSETDTIPPEKSLRKMFRHFGPIRESQTEVDKENNRARVVYRKSTDAEVAYNSVGRFSIFGTKTVNYELRYTITEAFKVEPYVVSLGDVSGTDQNPDDGGPATGNGGLKAGDDNPGNSVSDVKHVKADVASLEDLVAIKDNVEETVSSGDVERTDAITEPETEKNQMECEGDAGVVEVEPVNGESHENAGVEETVVSGGNEVTGEKEKCEVEEKSGAHDAEQNVQTESQQISVDREMLSVAEEKADQEEETARKSEEDDNKMDVDSKQANEENVGLHDPGSETKEANDSESAQVPEEPTQLSKEDSKEENPGNLSEVSSAAEMCREEEITNVNHKEENREAMEIDNATEEAVENNVTAGGVLDEAGNESAGASILQTQDVPIAEANRNDSNVVKEMEMEIGERKDDADMATDLTGTLESADLANPNSPTEDAASGNIQDLEAETGNETLKEDKKATDMAEGVATVETLKSVDAKVNAESRDEVRLSAEGVENESNEAPVATDCQKEDSDAILGSEENKEDNHEYVDQQDSMREEGENNWQGSREVNDEVAQWNLEALA
ncbi:unnamed protein product [Thlaspi arvense]|uniref:Dentin sialophosphoprotein-like n=1 Tax=Thlaspi arvense TaxID=13288 RepID=A0AAU9SDJ0_THLAR|nr:unnamed protein product [Thlaspi arvense]